MPESYMYMYTQTLYKGIVNAVRDIYMYMYMYILYLLMRAPMVMTLSLYLCLEHRGFLLSSTLCTLGQRDNAVERS